MKQSIAARRSRPLLFTSLAGEPIQVHPEELALTLPPPAVGPSEICSEALPLSSSPATEDIDSNNADVEDNQETLAQVGGPSQSPEEANESPPVDDEETADRSADPDLHSPPPQFPRTILKEIHITDDNTEVSETLSVQVDGPSCTIGKGGASIPVGTEDDCTDALALSVSPPPPYSKTNPAQVGEFSDSIRHQDDVSLVNTQDCPEALAISSSFSPDIVDKDNTVVNTKEVSDIMSAQVGGASQSVENDNPPVDTQHVCREGLASSSPIPGKVDKEMAIINTEEDSDNLSAQVDGTSQTIREVDGETHVDTLDGFIAPSAPRSPRPRCGTPLIEVVTPDELPTKPRQHLPIHTHHGKVVNKLAKRSSTSGVRVQMVYNEWGDLVPESTINVPPESDKLSVKQLLRTIKKGYNHDLRRLLSKLINPPSSGGKSVLVEDQIWTFRLSTWDLRLRTPQSTTPKTGSSPPCALTQRRVLEVGCSEGDWCFAFKKHQPDWVVNGIDETEHWACFDRGVPFRDFAKKVDDSPGWKPSDYFTGYTPVHPYPEFTVRNINHLTMHQSPIPGNFYEFVRGREIFDRIESYKMFLDDVRCILNPDGVVEFIEVDPRPRIHLTVDSDDDREVGPDGKHGNKKSTAPTNWTDCIVDRFKDPHDQQIARDVPGWLERVTERLNANLRPQDGIAAANLKSWIEGAGFWDVKEYVLPIPVGGETESGQLFKKYLLYQLELENSIPKLREELPEVEVAAFDSGKYHLNIHVVTGRKPVAPRTGDMTPDGHRMEMTHSTYDAMARFQAIKSSQWKRFDVDGDLTGIMRNLNALPGAPEQIQIPASYVDERIRHAVIASPFNAPPFVTLEESQLHLSESGLEKDGRSQSPRFGLPRLS